jgi:proteasome lid subunit RPN8/RPN11
MTFTPRIRLSPPPNRLPQPAVPPLESARRWFSPHEEAGERPPLSVFITQTAFSRADAHAASRLSAEVGGILVGRWCMDVQTDKPFIVIVGALPARFTRQGSVYLTFTQDSLVDLHAKIEEQYPGKEIVGWYHTHPHMGVFLSQYDTWLHEHFFPEPWQVALVIEPVGMSGGFFIRQSSGELTPNHYFGFYELDGLLDGSTVHWNNLRTSTEQSPESNEQEGDEPDE